VLVVRLAESVVAGARVLEGEPLVTEAEPVWDGVV
jgi:hypothetical protein